MFWRSMKSPTTPLNRWSAWTRSRSRCTPTSGLRSRPHPAGWPNGITSTNDAVPPMSSARWSLKPVGISPFRRGEGWRALEATPRSLHTQTWELAEPSGNRNQPVFPAMLGPPSASHLGDPATGSPCLELSGESEQGQDQLGIHAQESASKVRLQYESFKTVKDLLPII